MPDPASSQLQRIVSLIAWLSQRDTDEPVTYAAAAKHLGVHVKTLQADLDLMSGLGDSYTGWLASLSVGLASDAFTVRSRGAFRRPVRLTPEEVMVLALELNASRGGKAIAGKLLATLPEGARTEGVGDAVFVGPAPGDHVEQILSVVREALDLRRKVEISYCGSDGHQTRRAIHPHQVLEQDGHWYVNAWCETANAFRLFRCDRVLEARLAVEGFTAQQDYQTLSRADARLEGVIQAQVAFDPSIARWIREKHLDGKEDAKGRLVVTIKVADPAWFVREVLQYGDAAEVLGPATLREAVRRAVA